MIPIVKMSPGPLRGSIRLQRYELTVKAMSCIGCEERVTNAANQIDGVPRVAADRETESVAVTAEAATEDAVREAHRAAGYALPA